MNKAYNRETYPLSPLQEGMLFHTLASIGSGVDIEQIIGSIHEQLDVEAFQRAWVRVVQRHAVLRSQIEWKEISEPRQVVLTKVSFKGECFDYKHLSTREQEESLETYIQKDRAQGFDIGQVPLMRLAIFELGNAEYKFIWTFHHILLDGRAFPLILEDVFTFYEAFIENRDIELDDPRPFKDYVSWVGERILSKDEKFWRENLAGFTSPTPLVFGAPPAAEKRSMATEGSVEIRISKPLTSELQSLASSHGLSMNTLIEGAWALLLSRYNNEEDILYGTTRSCRRASIEGAESMIGLLINTVPLRVKIRKQTKVLDWLKQLREQHAQMREYIHSPLHQIQRWSDITHGSPLFESIVVFENYYLDSYMRSKGGRWLNREFEYRGRTNYPLTLGGYDDDEMLLRIEFDEGRFSRDTVQRMSGHLQTILQNIPGNLDKCVAEIPLLTEAERHQLLVEWNDTKRDYPKDKCIHELFEEQVERTPDAIALVFEDQRLTYRELNSRTNQLAHFLRKLGVGPEVLVGIFMERSVEMIISMYGILKAGGAYVPLDPEYPSDRVAFMAEDSQVPVLLTQEHLAAQLPHHKAKVICLDSAWPTIDKENWHNFVSGGTSENLAYVIYTSGSTGLPKGAMNTHRGIYNQLLWMQDAFQLTDGDRVLQKTPSSFDASVWECFLPLSFGAWLVVARPGGHKDSNYLVKIIQEQKITILELVPSMLQVFLDEKDVEKCNSLKQVFCGGEALPYELQEHFFTKLPAELHNLYGPTETAVGVTTWHCRRGSDRHVVPIGYPVANTQVYILDSHLQPVPVGIPGELHIGGVQVGRGYLNRPELTTEKFIPDPFSAMQGARLYRTGDLVRYLPGGEIEYLGRTDHQVKIRGVRIEPGEIEAVLGEHGAVREVVVMAREDVPGDKRLVAYIVQAGGETLSISVLRQHLKEKLPEYMVPDAFVMLEKFPLTPNGKIDRRALPDPQVDHRTEEGYIAPRNKVEETIASIWRELLRVNKVGINDSFFAIGGHSLLAIRAISQINKVFQVDLPLPSFFESPSIAGLSQTIEKLRNSGAAFQVPPIVPISRETRRMKHLN
jgi:amino acid adenylation domain-containing protein